MLEMKNVCDLSFKIALDLAQKRLETELQGTEGSFVIKEATPGSSTLLEFHTDLYNLTLYHHNNQLHTCVFIASGSLLPYTVRLMRPGII